MSRTPAHVTQADVAQATKSSSDDRNGMTTVDKNAPLRLADAAEIAFPFGRMTASGLRREAARGNLLITRITGKDFTTLRAIEEMFQKCQLTPKAPVSISAATRAPRQPGLSETRDVNLALASALATVDRLRLGSPPILPKNTSPRASAADDRREQPDIPNAPRSDPPASRRGAGKGMSRRAPAALS
jgi:hypothetical protein